MLVAQDAVEDAAVDARVVEGDVQDVHGRVLNVEGFPAAVPLHPILKALVHDVGHLTVIAVNLSPETGENHHYSLKTAALRYKHNIIYIFNFYEVQFV